jgi:drug/metabolite transporter (DMT)-like permease
MGHAGFLGFAALAGVFGALSGFAVKFATSGAYGPLPAAVVFAVGMAINVLCTGQMWRYSLKAMNLGSTAASMMSTVAVNMSLSALVGMVVLGEHLGLQYLIGSGLMITGLALVAGDPKNKEVRDDTQ